MHLSRLKRHDHCQLFHLKSTGLGLGAQGAKGLIISIKICRKSPRVHLGPNEYDLLATLCNLHLSLSSGHLQGTEVSTDKADYPDLTVL